MEGALTAGWSHLFPRWTAAASTRSSDPDFVQRLRAAGQNIARGDQLLAEGARYDARP